VAREAISYRFGECAPAVEQLEWLREHNRSRADSAAVHWYGMDLPGDSTSPEPALRVCLSRIAPAPGDDDLLRLADLGRRSRAAVRFDALSSADRDKLYLGIDDVIRRAATDEDPVARHCAAALAAFVAQSRWSSVTGDTAVHPRDAFMADTVRWVLEHHERVLVCAHNAHVQRSPLDGRPMLGGLLADRLGADLRVIGQTYGAGPEVRVLERSDRPFDWDVELVERRRSPGSLEDVVEHELADRHDASPYLVLPQLTGFQLCDGSAQAFDLVVHHRRVQQVPGAFARLCEDLEAT
jgi:erythromycin esterase-like protein